MKLTRSRLAPRLCLLLALLAVPGWGSAAPAGAATPPWQLAWAPCGDTPDTPDAECAGLPVPVDRARPDGPQITLRVARVRSTNPASGKPSMLIAPGGPGVGLADILTSLRGAYHIEELRRERDVYVFDPRGVGRS